jgi:O-antigen/teichoic acid export membrane protein
MSNKLKEAWHLGWAVARGLLRHEGSVGQKAVRSGFWVMIGMGAGQVIGLVQTVILVRLLLPADFGVMRIAGVVIAAVLVLTDSGVNAAIVQRRDLDRETIDTAWTMGVIRSVLLFVGVWFLAPLGASYYGNALITPIVRVVALGFIFSGFSNIGMTLLVRDLDFRTTEIYSVVVQVFGVTVTVVAAFILHSVWALAIGRAVFAAIKLVGSYIVHPYRPRFALSGRQVRSLLSFGLNMTAVGFIGFFNGQTASAVVGKVVGIPALGLYAVAFSLSNLPVNTISSVLNAVAFPTYSALQKDPAKLRGAMGEVLWVVTMLAVPASVGLWLLAPQIVGVVYGPKWLPMVDCFRILVVFGLARALSQVAAPVMLAVGKPILKAVGELINLAILATFIYPTSATWGIAGAGAAKAAAMVICLFWYLYQAERLCGGGLVVGWLSELGHAVGAAAAMGLTVYLFAVYGAADSAVGLLAVVLIGMGVYFAVALATRRQIYGRAKRIISIMAVR